MRPQTPNPNRSPRTINPKFQNETDKIVIERVTNNLPYSCILDIACPPGISFVYYAALDSKGKRLFYKSERPSDLLPGFSIEDLKTEEATFTFVCWPVTNGVIGKETKIGPLKINNTPQIGGHDLEVNFEGEDKILFQQIKPLIEKHYGKAALPGPIKVVPNSYDIYIPAKNIIKLSSNKRNLVHELIHASRKQLLFACKCGKYDETTEMIEEFFAEGIANFIKNEQNQSPNNYLKPGAVFGSTMAYNYDFRINDDALISQNLQSSQGGMSQLENSRYELASAAYHKVGLEYFINTGRYFGKDFNEIYYSKIQNQRIDPSKELFYEICNQLIDKIEGKASTEWLDKQKIFNCQIVQGEKTFMDFQDYPMHDEWIGICQIYHYETFANGSDWAMGKKLYNKNGKEVFVDVKEHSSGNIVFSKALNISNRPNAFGYLKLYFYHKEHSPGIAHFSNIETNYNSPFEVIFVPSGLYEITISTRNTQKQYFRIMGNTMFEDRNKLLFAFPEMKALSNIELEFQNKKGANVHSGKAIFNADKICKIDVPFISEKNCAHGILKVKVLDQGRKQFQIQRNIGYGGSHGGHQFLIEAPTNQEDLFV